MLQLRSTKSFVIFSVTVLLVTIVVQVKSQSSSSSSSSSSDDSCPDSNDFQCDNGDCIKTAYVCDGTQNCKDNSDEKNCDQYLCRGPKWYKCKNSTSCITSSFRCDGHVDCPLGDDEDNCDSFHPYHEPKNCSDYEWQCKDKTCIPKDLVCDGRDHCLDGSDETVGCDDTKTKCQGFLCKNRHCLESLSWVCDGKNDCGDNSDEENCHGDCTLDFNRFQCKDKSSCLPLEKVCDNKTDCTDGSDEGGSCSSQNLCTNLKCANKCQLLPTGAMCVCPTGFKFNFRTHACEDINECDIYGICSQGCINKKGSYQCVCADRYKLMSDNKTCAVTKGEGLMLYTTQNEVSGYYLKAHRQYAVAKNLSQVIGVTYDGIRVYWTDIAHKIETISRAQEDGTKREVLVTNGLNSPEDICIDWLTGNIYFTDGSAMHIAVCDNNAIACTVIVSENIHRPRGIALHPRIGVMYWTDWGAKPMIGISSMDGNGAKPFIEDDIHWPNGLSIDWPNGRLYWVDAKFRRIESIQFNGQNRKIVLEDVPKHPYGIAVFENRIYWSDWETRTIQSCNKFTGKDREILVRDRLIYDVHIFHRALQPHGEHQCVGHPCSHLCLLTINKGYTCACPKGQELNVDKRTCKDVIKKQFILIGLGNYLIFHEHEELGKNKIGQGNPLQMTIDKMVYNSVTEKVIIADNKQKIIFAVDLKTKETRELINREIKNITSLAFDHLSNNLYWTDGERGTVEVYSFNTKHRAILQHYLGHDIPIAVAVIPETGKMFIALHSLGQAHIDHQSMHGRGPYSHIIEENIGRNGMINFVVDHELESIFWADQAGYKIEFTSFLGDLRHLLRSNVRQPVSLAIVRDKIFWTQAKSGKLYWIDKKNNDMTVRRILIEKPAFLQWPEKIPLATTNPVRISDHVCMKDNGGCSHICVSLGQYSGACVCPPGLVFKDSKNLTCIENIDCEFRCGSGECLTLSRRCNGFVECADGSDEAHCKEKDYMKFLQCSYDEFKCANQIQCVPQEVRCDLNKDCDDGSDEEGCENYNHTTKCHKYQHACLNGMCIDVTALCDGIPDCSDGSDEVNCSMGTNKEDSVCANNMFRCNSGQCIDSSWECDGFIDCTDNSDEHYQCEKITCPNNYAQCARGTCIDEKLLCDGHNDCGDDSDEMNCGSTESAISCGNDMDDDDKYQCTSNRSICLDFSARCNGTAECPRGEDEAGCTGCSFHEFECENKVCIRLEWRCDREDDCGDGSDEENCLHSNQTVRGKFGAPIKQCRDNMFQCKDGTCIEMSQVCDGISDCANDADEAPTCQTACNNHPCSQKCIRSPNGPVCECFPGFMLGGNRKDCVDINECKDLNPCSQKCDNTVGSYRCSCYDGFLLRSDKTSCKSTGSSKYLLFSSYNQIRKLVPHPASMGILWSVNDSKITGMDVNIRENYLYVAVKEASVIYQNNLDTEEKKYVSDIGYPEKIAVDWITDNVYFADNHGPPVPSIKVCHIEGKACARLLQFKQRDLIKSLVVDGANKFMFFSVIHAWILNLSESVVYKANLDGTKREVLVKNIVHHITAMTLDPNKKILYMADMISGSIYSITYDGAEFKTLISRNEAINRPISLELFEDHLFVISMGMSNVAHCRVYGERNCKIFNTHVFNAEELAIVQESRQKMTENVCANHTCSVICVQANQGPKCLCHSGRRILPGLACHDADLKLSGFEMSKFDVFEDGIDNEDDDSGAVGVIVRDVFITLIVFALAGIAAFYFYKKRYQKSKFNISMHFQNPGLTTDSNDSAMVKMCNPITLNSGYNGNEISIESGNKKRYSLDGTVVMNDADDHQVELMDDNPRARLI